MRNKLFFTGRIMLLAAFFVMGWSRYARLLTNTESVSAAGGISFVQAQSLEGSSVGQLNIQFQANNSAGNLIIAFVRMSTTTQTVTVTDSAGNTYIDAVAQSQDTDGHQVHIFYAKNIFGGPNAVRATFSSTNNHPWLAIYEVSGLSTTNPLDQTAHAQGTDASPLTGVFTTTTPNELEFAAAGFPATLFTGSASASPDDALLQQDTGTSRAANELGILDTPGQYAASFSLSSGTNWSAVVATFVAASSLGPLTITTASIMHPATQGAVYRQPLTATGGKYPYTWSVTNGNLPPGLSLDASSGSISGTPTTPGTFNFTIQVVDSNSQTASRDTSIGVAPPVVITTTSFPDGAVGQFYQVGIQTTGGWGFLSYSATGTLPPGISKAAHSENPQISGTPTQVGTYTFTISARDMNGSSDSKTVSITINPSGSGGPIALVQSSAQEGSSVGFVAASFASANTAGNLIIAFVRMSSTSQTVSVTDSAGNAYTDAVFQAQDTDGHQIHIFYAKNIFAGLNTVRATFSSTNNYPWMAIYEYTGLSTTNPLDQTAHAQGNDAGPRTGVITTTNPNELEFAAAGFPATLFTGTVTAGNGYTLLQQDTGTSRATNEGAILNATGQYAGSFSLSSSTSWSAVVATFVAAGSTTNPPSIQTTGFFNADQNIPYNATLQATGGTTPYTWSIASGSLPAGLNLNASTGVISGSATGPAGQSNFTVQVKDSSGQTATQPLSLTINRILTSTSGPLEDGDQNTHYITGFAASGGEMVRGAYGFQVVSGSLPPGLSIGNFDSTTGQITGVPTATGTFNFTVQVTDFYGQTATGNFSITIHPPLVITTTSLPSGTQNTAYSATLNASGGNPPYGWFVTSGSLPTGLALNQNTGTISGIPTVSGTSNFTIRVTDNSFPGQVTQSLSITINPSGGGGGSIGLVQSRAVEGSGVGSVSTSFAVANTAGNLIVAFVRMSTTFQTVAVTDSAGNLYTDAVAQTQDADGHQVHIFYAKNIVAGPNTVKASFSATNNHPWLAIYEYRGLSTTNPLDQVGRAQGSDNSPFTGLITTTAPNELEFAATGLPATLFSGSVAAGPGYTLEQQDTGTSRAANEDAALTTTGQYAGRFNLSSNTNWTAIVATFK